MSLDAELDADLHAALVEMGVIQTNGAGQPPSISGSAVDASQGCWTPPPRLSPKSKPAASLPNSPACTGTARLPVKAAHDLDAVFYARLLRDFGATYLGSRRSRQRSGS